MSIVEHFVSGLLEERPNRGVRAISWLVACAYVLSMTYWRGSVDITVIAIEASAIIGAVRAIYVLWTMGISKNHRLHRLEESIRICKELCAHAEGSKEEISVRLVMLRDRLAKLELGLPKEGALSALEILEVYAKERNWSMASDMFPAYLYGYTKKDRDTEITRIIDRQPHVTADQQWTNRIVRYERKRKRLELVRVALGFTMAAYVAVSAIILDVQGREWWFLVLTGASAALCYYWLLGAVSRRRSRSVVRKIESSKTSAEKKNVDSAKTKT